MKAAVLYSSLLVDVAAMFGMEGDYQVLRKNALIFDNQCKTMENLIAEKIKRDSFANHMYNNLLMRNWYLKKSLSEKIQQSFLQDYYILPDQNESINKLCDDLISSYIKYSNERANEEATTFQWQELVKDMQALIISHLFLYKN